MNHVNIRIVNGNKHNPHLDSRHVQVQNRAAAVLDAWSEYGEALSVDLVAHMHRISVSQIQKDLYNDPADIKRRFGLQSTVKLEHALQRCQKELKKGENQALIVVANHVPFMLLRSLRDNGDMKELARLFLNDMNQKLLLNEREKAINLLNKSSETRAGEFKSRQEPLCSIENRPIDNISTLREKFVVDGQHSDCLISTLNKRMNFDQPEMQSISTCFVNSSSSIQHNSNENGLLNVDPPEHVQRLTSNSTYLYHRTNPFHSSQIQMEWKMLHVVGSVLDNKDQMGSCRNICSINAVIQCLSVSALFVQWLLTETVDAD